MGFCFTASCGRPFHKQVHRLMVSTQYKNNIQYITLLVHKNQHVLGDEETEKAKNSSDQFNVVSKHLGKLIHIPPLISEASQLLLLKQFQCPFDKSSVLSKQNIDFCLFLICSPPGNNWCDDLVSSVTTGTNIITHKPNTSLTAIYKPQQANETKTTCPHWWHSSSVEAAVKTANIRNS